MNAGDTVGVFLSLEQADRQVGRQVEQDTAEFPQGAGDGSAVQQRHCRADRRIRHRVGNQPGVLHIGHGKAQTDETYLITIARNSADAERIVFAAEFGKVYLSKEPGDAVEAGASYVDSSGLFR